MSQFKLRVLLTAAAGPGGIGITHALKSHPTKQIDVIIGVVEENDKERITCGKEIIIIPYAKDEKYVDKMIGLCEKHDIKLIVPGFSEECLVLAKNREIFEKKDIKIICPTYENVKLCHNKDKMQQLLEENNSKYLIPYKVVHTIEEIKTACLEMGYPNEKLCVKPAACNGGSRGFFVLDENYDRYKSYFIEKDSKVCTLDEIILKLKGVENMPKILVMKYIQGQEYGIDVFANEGETVGHVIRKRCDPKIAGIDMKVEIEDNEILSELTYKIVKELRLNSVINIDIIYDKIDKKPYVLEINPRQSAYIGASVQKTNLMAMAIDFNLGEELNLEVYRTNYTKVKAIRYINEIAICEDEVINYNK